MTNVPEYFDYCGCDPREKTCHSCGECVDHTCPCEGGEPLSGEVTELLTIGQLIQLCEDKLNEKYDSTVDDILRGLRVLKNDCAVIVWTAEDVVDYAQQGGRSITYEQARQVVKDIEHHHDCTVGITWETIWLSLPEEPDNHALAVAEAIEGPKAGVGDEKPEGS